MLRNFSERLLTLLQLTRMALVFTAVADSLCSVLLAARQRAGEAGRLADHLHWGAVLAAAAVSVGLYGFGMSLNDIIDRRRDRQIAAHRPLPSGRVGVFTAHAVCVALGLLALAAGLYYAHAPGGTLLSAVLVVWTGMLIAFYDLAGKYLVAPGLITLGLIRFFHALIPAPQVPVLWHPLLLLNHVAILSAVAYHWEEKRPPLTRLHWWAVFGGLALVDVLAVSMVASRRGVEVDARLIVPLACAAAFVLIGWNLRRKASSGREAGQSLMLYGLLWLIVYDAAFVAAYVRSWAATAVVLLLLPVAYLSVQLMRWWSKLLTLSQKPAFKRART